MNFLTFLREGEERVPEHETVDKSVWMTIGSKEPILSDEIYKQIMMDVSFVQDIVMVDRVYLTGDLLTKHWLDNTPMDIYVVIGKDNVTPIAYEKLMKFTKSHEGDFAGHTRHPLKYHIELLEDDEAIETFEKTAPGIYDILKQKWLKIPSSPTQEVADRVSVFMGRVRQIGLDSSARIDWDYFLNVDEDNLEQLKSAIQSKAFELYLELSEESDEVKKFLRKYAYGDPPTIEEIEKFYDKEKIPATIIYKLVMQYYMGEYIKRLADKMGDNRMTTKNELPPDGESPNRFDPFPRDNIPESNKMQSFGEFLTESGLKQPYKPRGFGCSRRSGVQRKLSNKSEIEKLTTEQDDAKKIVVNNGVMHGDKLADALKEKDFACVPLTDKQARDIELKYDLTHPDEKYPFRRLGKTDGMAIIRKAPKRMGEKPGMVLMKNNWLDGMSGGIKK